MRALLLAALLSVPLAVAEPAAPVRVCTELACVLVLDRDGDGAYDWANAALAVDELLVANANANRTVLLWEVEATNEELGGGTVEEIAHEVEELTGIGVEVVTLSVVGSANMTAQDGSPGFHEADILVALLVMDHETGQQEAVFWQYARAYDADGDNVPDGVETLP